MKSIQPLNIEKYLAVPWVFGECGFIKGMDCSTLCVSVQCELGNYIPLAPECSFDDAKGMKHALLRLYEYFKDDDNWQPVDLSENPKHGDIIVMNKRNSKSGKPRHVGTYLDVDGGKILHTMRVLGARLTEPHRLSDFDYKIIECYRWQS